MAGGAGAQGVSRGLGDVGASGGQQGCRWHQGASRGCRRCWGH